ncbi:GNAT family N-acetyltransferase [Edaphobacter bradus]|uniref:GNAT family N-acetyltransferase n=1 Tax=Edaphobacter bradus TaxID=2259016 RepID=UPI0021DF88D3|nr:GNAT family N-acetyltransferase [Edaphobacter bradus]
MTVTTQLEILDLRHFSARQLRPLLEAEARMWNLRLRWDYQSSTELLLQYLDSRILPGFVSLDRGRICGFAFCVYEGHKAVVGDAWSFTADPDLTRQSTYTLLHRLLDLLLYSPGINRIESQLLLYDSGTLSEPFLSAGFKPHPRLFLEHDLTAAPTHDASQPSLPGGIDLVPWSTAFYQVAAALIHDSYANHIDALINDQYCTLHGSLRFLHNIVRFPGCGVFEPQQSWVLRHRATGALIGMLLCSRVAEDVAHITQLCVASAWRGHRLGAALLHHAMNHLTRSSTSAITLTVTEVNRPAVELYLRSGFFIRQRFDAMVYDKPGS